MSNRGLTLRIPAPAQPPEIVPAVEPAPAPGDQLGATVDFGDELDALSSPQAEANDLDPLPAFLSPTGEAVMMGVMPRRAISRAPGDSPARRALQANGHALRVPLWFGPSLSP